MEIRRREGLGKERSGWPGRWVGCRWSSRKIKGVAFLLHGTYLQEQKEEMVVIWYHLFKFPVPVPGLVSLWCYFSTNDDIYDMTGVFVWLSHHPFATHLGCQDNGGCPAQPPACCEAARRAEAAAKMVQDQPRLVEGGTKKNGRKKHGDYNGGLIDWCTMGIIDIYIYIHNELFSGL